MDIAVIYILEAHFVERDSEGNYIDGWPIGYQYNYPQTKSIAERCLMVDKLKEEFTLDIPVYIDNMENDFSRLYKSWPDNAYIYRNGQLIWASRVNKDGTRSEPWTGYIEKFLNLS